MVFSSGIFLIYFLPLFAIGYFLIKDQFKNPFLLLLSIFFYWWGAPLFSIIVLITSSLNFYVAGKIPSSNKPKNYLYLYVFINLALLAYFKYANFFIENVNEILLSFGYTSIEWTKIALPIGISFFTFQSITYGVDIYRKDANPQKKLLNYWFYILFFPQLIAGPIVTYSSISNQLIKRDTSLTNFLDGMLRFTIGLSKKVLIANVLAEFGNELNLYQETHAASVPLAWLTALAYTFEIYFDFSGYSDMAIGLGKIVGFDFPENFNRPYLSISITQFWRRWHITLGDFMKKYLYIPLGGNKTSPNRTYINLITVFVLSGLWHGAAWNFIAWGLFHGVWLLLERITPLKLGKKFNPLRITFTFLIVVHGWVLFDAGSLNEAILHLQEMYSFDSMTYWDHQDSFYFISHLIIAVVICLLGIFSPLFKLYEFSFEKASKLKNIVAFTSIGLAFSLCLSHLLSGSFNPFIYFQF